MITAFTWGLLGYFEINSVVGVLKLIAMLSAVVMDIAIAAILVQVAF